MFNILAREATTQMQSFKNKTKHFLDLEKNRGVNISCYNFCFEIATIFLCFNSDIYLLYRTGNKIIQI